ncbi:MAG: LamG domain-containing protein, partial [Deltaproteobacteria bacterium]
QIDELTAWTSAINAVEMEAAYAEGLRGNPLEKEMQEQAYPVAAHRYSFDDADYSDPVLVDMIGGIDMNNVVVTGPPTKAVSGVAGQINQAFDFQGEQLLQSGSNSYNLGTEFSIGAWINRSGNGTILNKWDTTPNIPLQEFRLYISSGKLAFDYHTTATDTWGEVGYDTITSLNNVPSGTWSHVMVTRKDGDLRLYIDGKLEATKDIGTNPLNDVAYPLSIGGETASGSNFFTGQIDEIQIWKKNMEERQVKLVYNTNFGGSAATTDSSLTVAEYSSNVVGINPVRISVGNCKDTNILIQDSGAAAPLAGAISTPCSEGVAGHNSSALPATSDTVDVYFGDGASTVDGPYPINVIYSP